MKTLMTVLGLWITLPFAFFVALYLIRRGVEAVLGPDPALAPPARVWVDHDGRRRRAERSRRR